MANWHGIRIGPGARPTKAYSQERDPDEGRAPVEEADIRIFAAELSLRAKRLPQGEIELRLAVIERVIEDLEGCNEKHRESALEWVDGGADGTGYGLADIAELLGVDLEMARRALRARAA